MSLSVDSVPETSAARDSKANTQECDFFDNPWPLSIEGVITSAPFGRRAKWYCRGELLVLAWSPREAKLPLPNDVDPYCAAHRGKIRGRTHYGNRTVDCSHGTITDAIEVFPHALLDGGQVQLVVGAALAVPHVHLCVVVVAVYNVRFRRGYLFSHSDVNGETRLLREPL
ncbi:hypothetical protein MRX96_027038 [Rhipicephalus microplus]